MISFLLERTSERNCLFVVPIHLLSQCELYLVHMDTQMIKVVVGNEDNIEFDDIGQCKWSRTKSLFSQQWRY